MMRRLASAGLVLLAAACATLEPARAPDLRACAEFFAQLDARVDEAGVRDAQAARVRGFAYLRVSRLLASYRDEDAPRSLARRMQALDLEARRHELANLGASDAPLERARDCGDRLREADLADAQASARLLERAVVPEDYSTPSRLLGLYAITRLPFIAGVRRYEQETREAFRKPLAPPPDGEVIRFAPTAGGNPGIHALLLAAHAPVFEIEVTGDYDRPGALGWRSGEPVPTVNPAEPIVYAHAAWTRYRGRTLQQLVYTIWFAERPPVFPGDILAGKLDGVVWRVTLAPDGEPLLYDSMHPCGCFHMFFPTPRAKPLPPPASALEWNFSPQAMPHLAEGERARLRIATRTHYVERVGATRDAAGDARYALREYDELRSMPHPEGGRRSVFGEHGLIAGTERPERFLFWPMGIRSAGAMRQWGRHATAFVGRRHFDDADLLEQRFELDLR
ncbi:MAG: hypothetical protein WD886_02250 [Burkholderiales bacterium]